MADDLVGVAESVQELVAEAKQINRALHLRMRFILASIAVLTVALAGVGVTLYQTVQISQDNEAAVARIDATRDEVLCPLYGVFLGSYDPNSDAAKRDPEGYEDAFKVISTGAAVLGCDF